MTCFIKWDFTLGTLHFQHNAVQSVVSFSLYSKVQRPNSLHKCHRFSWFKNRYTLQNSLNVANINGMTHSLQSFISSQLKPYTIISKISFSLPSRLFLLKELRMARSFVGNCFRTRIFWYCDCSSGQVWKLLRRIGVNQSSESEGNG